MQTLNSFSLMNARKAKNVITKLELDDGSIVDSEDDIVCEITGFFHRLYKTEGMRFRGIEGIDWQPIPQHLADWLERPFEEEEIKRAIQDRLKDDILRVFGEFAKDGIIHGITNETYIYV